MKKITKNLMTIMTAVVLCMIAVMTASATETFTDGYYSYTVTDNEATITKVSTDIRGDVVIPDTLGGYPVRVIGEYAFKDCYKITSVCVSDNVREIRREAFLNNYLLKHLDLGDGVEEIIDEPFYKLWSLETVHIGKNLRTIFAGSFDCCLSLEKITVDGENPYFYADEAGVLYDKINSVLVRYPAANKATAYTVADATEAIGEYAFSNSMYLETLNFPVSLKEIGSAAFSFSSGIKEIYIPSSVTKIGSNAFVLSFSLEKIFFEADTQIIDFLAAVDRELLLPATEIAELIKQTYIAKANGDNEKAEELNSLFESSFRFAEEIIFGTTIYCHDDNNTSGIEEYAKTYGIPFERCHFYENEWNYDYDSYVRYKNCTYENCTAKITEELEKEEIGDVEIVGPSDSDTDFEVDNIENDKFILIEENVKNNIGEDYTVLKAFDITLKNKDGVHVQPDGTVKVKLPLDWEKDGNYKVYRVNDDGTLTDMNAYRQGSHMVFDTDHFSVYVIVGESEKADTPVETPEEKEDFIHKLFAFIISIIEFFRSLFIK